MSCSAFSTYFERQHGSVLICFCLWRFLLILIIDHYKSKCQTIWMCMILFVETFCIFFIDCFRGQSKFQIYFQKSDIMEVYYWKSSPPRPSLSTLQVEKLIINIVMIIIISLSGSWSSLSSWPSSLDLFQSSIFRLSMAELALQESDKPKQNRFLSNHD